MGDTAVEQAIADDGITKMKNLLLNQQNVCKRWNGNLKIMFESDSKGSPALHNDYDDLEYSTVVNFLLYL